MPRLSLGLGVSSSSKLPSVAAPAGIAVASTASVVIAGQNGIVPDGTYAKVTANGTRVAGSAVSDKLLLDTGLVYLKEAGADVIDGVTLAYGQILVPPNTTFTSTYGAAVSPEPFWRAGVVRANYSEDDPYFYFAFLTISTNSSTDPTTIPTTGWSPSITITAAIPVSTTTFSINGGNAGYPTITVSKLTGNTDIYPCYYQTGSSDPTTKYTFSHLWRNNDGNGSWQEAHIGVATRKLVGGSGNSFISGSNCLGESTEAVSPTWVLFRMNGDEYGPVITTLATNPSQDFNNIPTTGWVVYGEISSVTITAA